MIRQSTQKKSKQSPKNIFFVSNRSFGITIFFLCILGIVIIGLNELFATEYQDSQSVSRKEILSFIEPKAPELDTAEYDRRMVLLANYPVVKVSTSTSTSTPNAPGTTTPNLWPKKTVYPNVDAILPFKRVVAYYGNFYSTRMGVLGEHPTDIMLTKLKKQVQEWEIADPETPVVPAIHYIAVTAQSTAGTDGKYRLRMPDSQIDEAIRVASLVNGIVFLDIQVGLSTLESELPHLKKYLALPQVHLGIDPEFSMKTGVKPGKVIGTFDATDINYAANYLAHIVRENNLPPKILVIHRFTGPMITRYKTITPLPEVQVVIHMDGWGTPDKKIGTYNHVILPEPVQFAGFKIFYKNDLLPPSPRIMTPAELLKLKPRPIYIQYQ